MTMQSRQVGTRIAADVPLGRRKLAEALGVLYKHLGVATLEAAASLLAARGYRKDRTELSRYLNGRRLPPKGFVERLHATAVEVSGADAVMPLAKILDLHRHAEKRLCRSCAEGREENRRLRAEIRVLRRSRAGSREPVVALREPVAQLPVPPAEGDRRMEADVAAARWIAVSLDVRAEQLHRAGDEEALVALFREGLQVMTPADTADAIVLLRKRRSAHAETLIQMAGRDTDQAHSIRTALELIELGRPDDAGKLLRAAAR
jgi:transcriptional regulator with XRE-family HTH domain